MLGQKGLSLIELIITIMIAGILLSMAVPNFREFIQNMIIETETNRLIKDIQMARDEAMKRGRSVIICRSENPENVPRTSNYVSPSPDDLTCGGGTAADWSSGWFIFISFDNDTDFDTSDKLFSVSQAPSSDEIEIFANGAGAEFLQFNPDATTNADGNIVRFSVCDDRGAADGELIEVPPVGRPRLANAVSDCSNGS